MDSKRNRLMKWVFGIAFMTPWVIYQVTPLFEGVIVLELILGILMACGILILATLKKYEGVRIALPRV